MLTLESIKDMLMVKLQQQSLTSAYSKWVNNMKPGQEHNPQHTRLSPRRPPFTSRLKPRVTNHFVRIQRTWRELETMKGRLRASAGDTKVYLDKTANAA